MNKYILSGTGLIILDQITKQLAEIFLVDTTIHITHWFRLYLTYNEGIAFSISVPRVLLIVLTLGFLVFFFCSMWPTFKNTSQKWSGTLVIAGAIGNLIDRFFLGAVIDFLSFWSFPVFNVADILISVGVFGLMLSEFFQTKK